MDFLVFQLNDGFGVRNPRSSSEKDGSIKFFTHPEGNLYEFLCFSAVCGFQHWNLGSPCIMPVVLFILRAVQGGIVRADDNQPSLSAGVTQGKKRISGNINAHMFHYDKGACSTQSRSYPHLKGHFLIRSPLGVNSLIPGKLLQYFCTRGSRIGRSKGNAMLICPPRYRLIS